MTLILVAVAIGAGCAQQQFNDALDGVPSDPDSFELDVISCVNDGEFITYEWGLTNLTDAPKTFAFDPFFVNIDGEEEMDLRALVGEQIPPGGYQEWDGFADGGERFPVGDVECRFEVVDSVLGFQRGEN